MFRLVPMQAPLRHRRIVWIAAAAVVGAAICWPARYSCPTTMKNPSKILSPPRRRNARPPIFRPPHRLKNALAKDPENRTARLLCAQLHIDLGDGEAAQGQLRHARLDHPDEAEAYLIKGFEANPDDPLAAAAMALHRLAQGKDQAAFAMV